MPSCHLTTQNPEGHDFAASKYLLLEQTSLLMLSEKDPDSLVGNEAT